MGHSRILLLLALGPLVLAEGSDTDKPKPKAEATVTVTAEAVPVEVTRTPSPVRIVDAEELARLQVRTLGDLLAAIQPGAVMGSGGSGSVTSVFLNGSLSRNVVILLDGVRLNDPTEVSPNLGAIGLVGIDRVELLLGPSSVLHGSDAIGGVINLRSASPTEAGCHGSASVKGGTQAQSAASANAQVKGAWGWIAAGGEASRQGSDFPGDAFRQTGGFLRVGQEFGTLALTLHYRNSGQTASVPFDTDYTPQRVYVADRETHARNESWGAGARWSLSKDWVLEGAASAMEGENGDPAGAGRVQTERSFRRTETNLGFHWTPSAVFRLSGRMEGRLDRSEAANYFDPLTWSPVRYQGEGRDLAGALEGRWELSEGLDWVTGVRSEGAHRDLTRSATGLRSRAGAAEATTFKTGLNWVLRPALRLYASFGQGFRMPNLTEFMLNAQASEADQATYRLDPEHSHTLQMGATGQLGGGFEYRVEAQRTRLSDLLAYRSGALITGHYGNAGNVQSQSLEGALGWRGGEVVVWGWNLCLRSQDTRDLDHDVEGQRYGQVTSAIVRHPFFTCSASGFFLAGAWRGDLRWDRIGPRYDINDLTYEVVSTGRPFQELNGTLSWAVARDLSLTLRGEHLLQPKQSLSRWLDGSLDQNGNAQLVYGYPAPSRRVSLAATYRW